MDWVSWIKSDFCYTTNELEKSVERELNLAFLSSFSACSLICRIFKNDKKKLFPINAITPRLCFKDTKHRFLGSRSSIHTSLLCTTRYKFSRGGKLCSSHFGTRIWGVCKIEQAAAGAVKYTFLALWHGGTGNFPILLLLLLLILPEIRGLPNSLKFGVKDYMD